jgi:hypothetical protein
MIKRLFFGFFRKTGALFKIFGIVKMYLMTITNPAIYRREHDALNFPGFQPLRFFGRTAGVKTPQSAVANQRHS